MVVSIINVKYESTTSLTLKISNNYLEKEHTYQSHLEEDRWLDKTALVNNIWPGLIIKWDIKYKHMDNFSRMCMHEAVGSKFELLCSQEHAKWEGFQQLMDSLLNKKSWNILKFRNWKLNNKTMGDIWGCWLNTIEFRFFRENILCFTVHIHAYQFHTIIIYKEHML